jgi:hypothetical protein
MRLGFNPHKDIKSAKTIYNHQIIVPVYIPNHDGFFKDSFDIFKLSLKSLLKTTHTKTFISIINNGSCIEIVDFLNDLFKENKIQEIIHTENIGKVNAILKGLVGSNIDLVTIADSDVLFLDNWQIETIKVFNNFPKAGVVGVVPQIRTFEYMCGNLLFENLFTKKIQFSEVKDTEAFKGFYNSIGWKDDYNPDYLKQILTIENNNSLAVVGSGHFVATYRRDVFKEIQTYFNYKLGGDSERYLDEILLKYNLWRLTTYCNYANHMGNTLEHWMKEKVENLTILNPDEFDLVKKKPLKKQNKIVYFICNKLFIRLFANRKFRKLLYGYFKLPKAMIQNY